MIKELIYNMEKSKLLNGTTLAFIGDAYYDLMIRKYLVSKLYKSKDLHELTTKYVSLCSSKSH